MYSEVIVNYDRSRCDTKKTRGFMHLFVMGAFESALTGYGHSLRGKSLI